MRVTIAELLGKITAAEGQALERDASLREWERQHAAEIQASRARYRDALRRIEIDLQKRYPEPTSETSHRADKD